MSIGRKKWFYGGWGQGLLAMVLFGLWPHLSGAVPANQKVWTFTQPDGTKFQAILRGDEYYAYHETPDHQVILQNPQNGTWHYAIPQADGSLQQTPYIVGKSKVKTAVINKDMTPWLQAVEKMADAKAQAMTQSFRSIEQAPSTGTIKGVMLLANFSDTVVTYSAADFTNLLNQSGYNSNGASGSVRDYYLEASYGQLTVQTDVYGWFNLPNSRAYYGANTSGAGTDANARQMIIDAINASDSTVNYANYDADGDGVVDFFGVIHQGQGEEQTGASPDCIWSHRWNLATPMTVDGKKISDYHTEPEKYYSSLSTIGVFCHEMGHVFGLPDLYDTTNASNGIGNWSVMATGSWAGPGSNGSKPVHFDPWCKVALGWITPTVVTTPQSGAALPAFDANASTLLLPVDPYADGEYFLVTNRYARATGVASTGFEQYLPGSGALILHVEDYILDNSVVARKKVDVEEADGLGQLDSKTNRGDAGDLYPNGGATFNDASNPNSRDNNGNVTNISLSNFTGAGTSYLTCAITPRALFGGTSIAYDSNGYTGGSIGYGDGDDYACVRFTTATGGTLKRVKTYFNYTGTTNYTVWVYSGGSGYAPTGLLTSQSGTHTGMGGESITLTSPPTLGIGDFFVKVRYNTSGGNLYPIPLSIDAIPDARGYISPNGSNFFNLKTDYGYNDDVNIRADLTPPAPSVSSITRVSANPAPAGNLDFLVTFGQVVLGGSAANFSPTTTGGLTATVTGISGSGATRTITVNVNNGTGTVRLDAVNSSGLTDVYGQALAGLPYTGGQAYDINPAPPAVSSILLAGSNPTNGATVGFTVNFSHGVSGVDASDFALATTGLTGAAIAGVSGSGQTYTVSVNTGTGNGTIRLDVLDDDTIIDNLALPLGGTGVGNGAYTSGPAYTIDKTAPTLTAATPASGAIVAGVTSVQVTFSKSVSGVAAANLSVGGSPATTISGSGSGPYTFGGFATPADGTVAITLASGSIVDTAGNGFAGSTWNISKRSVKPKVTLASTAVASGGAINQAAVFTATFDQSVNGFVASDVTVTNGSVSGFSGSGKTYQFTVTPTANGATTVAVAAGVANDAVAPYSANTASSTYSFTYDTIVPSGTVTINKNATWTSSTAVNLTLSALDSGSGVAQMRLRNDSAWDTESWITYSTSPSWTLTAGEGSKTVTAQFRDRAGNVSANATATIALDATPPLSQMTAPTNNSTLTTSNFTLRWSASDARSGVRSVRIVWRKNGGTTFTLTGSPFVATQTSTPFVGSGTGSYSFYSIATDKAGNTEIQSGYDIRVTVQTTGAPADRAWRRYE